MTVFTSFKVNDVLFEPRTLDVKRTMHDSNSSSSFKAIFDTPFGRLKDSFIVGQIVDIFADESDGTTKIFSGVIETINFKGRGTTQTATLTGRDFSLRLLDMTAQPQIFSNTEVSEIITGLLTNNLVPDITTNNVNVTTKILPRMSYNHESIFDAFSELAKIANFIFYVDEDKDLHFEERKSISTGVTIGNDQNNLLSTDLKNTRQGMGNIVWVYGDRYLSGFQENLATDGGSDYTLLSRPHNTEIFSLGLPLKGSIKDITLTPTSGADYEVDFFDRKIIFLSGTDIGYSSIPETGGSIIVNYQRELPIVKNAVESQSIDFYGPKVKIIRDKSIKDPNTALDLLKATLQDSNPLNRLKCSLKGFFTFNPGEKVIYDLNDFGIQKIEMSIVEILYKFNKNTIQNNTTISLTLSKKLLDITDQIKDMNTRLVQLESADVSDTDILTRLIISEESVQVVGSRWNVLTSTVTGSAFHLYSTGFVPPINPFHLASGTDEGRLAGSFTGSAQAFSTFSIAFSGGNDYSVTGSYDPAGSEGPSSFGTFGAAGWD